MEASLPNSLDPDTDKFKIQDSEMFKQQAPWFKRIPLERVGPEKR